MQIFLTIIGLALVILIHEVGHFLAAKLCKVRVDEFGIGFPPRIFSKKIGETRYCVNLLPLGGYVKIRGDDFVADEPENPSEYNQLFTHKAWYQKIFILSAGVIMNVLLGWFILVLVFVSGIERHVVIADVSLDSPAMTSGLLSGDIILSMKSDDAELAMPVETPDVIAFVENAKGNNIGIMVKRSGEELLINVVRRDTVPQGEGRLGVSLIEVGFPPQKFFKSFVDSAGETFRILGEIILQLGKLVKSIFTDQNALGGVTGPVGIFEIAVETSSLGFLYFLHFIGFISFNIAMFNLLPFPALDGGRILFVVIEKITKRNLSQRFQVYANMIGFSLLLLLLVVVTVRDVGRLW